MLPPSDPPTPPFSVDCTPGGLYFTLKEGRVAPADPAVFYAFGLESLGWGYCDTPFKTQGTLPSPALFTHPVVILHQSMHAEHAPTRKIEYQLGDYVLIQTRG